MRRKVRKGARSRLWAVWGVFAVITCSFGSWELRAPLPSVPPGLVEAEGAALTYAGGHYIYAILGGGSNEFLRYNTTTDQWDLSPRNLPVPAGFNSGAALAADVDAGLIYAFRGGGMPDFWCYTIAGDTWYQQQGLPVNVGAGGALAFANQYGEKFIYALAGGGSPTFWRWGRFGPGGSGPGRGTTYNWYPMPSLRWPPTGQALFANAGGCLTWAHSEWTGGYDSIFCIPCDPLNVPYAVIAYSVQSNTWSASMPFDPGNENVWPGPGCALTARNVYPYPCLYCLLGDIAHTPLDLKTRARVPSGGGWANYDNTIFPPYQRMGAAIAYGYDDYNYAFIGDHENKFQRNYYTIPLGGGGQSGGTSHRSGLTFRLAPSPVVGGAVIEMSIPRTSLCRVEVLDAAGRLVAVLLDRELTRGDHRVSWSPRLATGGSMPKGVYLLRLTAGAEQKTRSFVIN